MGIHLRFISSPVTFVITFVAIGFIAVVLARNPDTPSNTYVLLLGASAAWLALISNAANALIQSRKQHTITTLFQTRMSATYHEKLDAFFETFPEGKPICIEEFDEARASTEKKKSVDALKFLLNYYEFLAVGIKRKDLDETLLRETVRGLLCNIVEQCAAVIKFYREENPKVGTTRRWENLVVLYGRWKDPSKKTDLGQGKWGMWFRFRFFLAKLIAPAV